MPAATEALDLRVGLYLVTAELQGFRRVIRDGVAGQLGQAVIVDVTLEVSGLTEEIKVTGGAPQVQTTNAEIEPARDADRHQSGLLKCGI